MIVDSKNLPAEGLTKLFKLYSQIDPSPIIELQDNSHKPVAALYFETLRYKTLAISETKTSENYFLYIDGIGIYFSYFKKLCKNSEGRLNN